MGFRWRLGISEWNWLVQRLGFRMGLRGWLGFGEW